MLRKGYDSKLIFDRKARLIGFSTGSEACSEHECGSNTLQASLCSGFESLNGKIDRHLNSIKANAPLSDQICLDTVYKTKRIDKPGSILFEEFSENGESFGMIYFGASLADAKREILPISFAGRPLDCSGGWDKSSFAFAVRGQKLISKLKDLFQRIQSNESMFAGTFYEEKGVLHAGVLIIDRSSLRPEDRQRLKKADVKAKENLIKEIEKRLKSVMTK